VVGDGNVVNRARPGMRKGPESCGRDDVEAMREKWRARKDSNL
jgi:hypothetical protein